MGDALVVRQDGSAVEIVDEQLGSWVCRIAPLPTPASSTLPRSVVAGAVVSGMAAQLPALGAALAGGGAMQVTFSPAVREAVAAGTYHLLQTASGPAPIAVNSAGRIVEHARVVGGAAQAVSLAPLLLTGVGMAASIAHQLWLDKTLTGIASTLDAIATRLDDDRWGLLEHASGVASACWNLAGRGHVPAQARLELAAARLGVGSAARSHARASRRLIAALEAAYDQKTGESREPWDSPVVRALNGRLDDVLVHLAGLRTMAQIDAATAAVLTIDGAGDEAVRLVDASVAAASADYKELYRYFRPLARFEPSTSKFGEIVDRIPVDLVASRGPAAEARRVHAQATQLFEYLDRQVGDEMPAISSELHLVVELEPQRVA